MSSEANLSPEEIQALLDDSAVATAAGGGSLTSEQLETIRELSNIGFGAASASLAVILSKEVDVPAPEIQQTDNLLAYAEPFTGEPKTMISAGFTGELQHNTAFLAKTADLQTMAALMMPTEEAEATAGELSELQTSAVSEAFNQMITASATSLGSMINSSVEAVSPVVAAYTPDGLAAAVPELAAKALLAIQFDVQIGDASPIPLIQLITVEDALSQVDKLMSADNGQEPVAMAANPSENRHANPVTVQPVAFSAFDNQPLVSGEYNKNLDLVLDVTLNLTVQLGSTELSIKQILELTRGSVIELDRIAGEAVDLMANGKLIAKGEVVVIEDNFGLRITNIVSPEDRLRGLTG